MDFIFNSKQPSEGSEPSEGFFV